MYIVLGAMSLLSGIIGACGTYVICRNSTLKKHNGKPVIGRKINCEELTGRPRRYIVEVEYQLNNRIHSGKIVTTDKKIKKYADNERLPLLYVDAIDKIYWAEDNAKEKSVCILLLISFCIVMLLLSGVCFVLYLG